MPQLPFRRFVIENDSEYANSSHPEYDLWKHARPAIRHIWDNAIYTGNRGDTYDDIYKRIGGDIQIYNESKQKNYCEGMYHTITKKFYETCENIHDHHLDTHMSAIDLMTNLQRAKLSGKA